MTGIEVHKGIICWILIAVPMSLVSLLLYRRKIISAKVLVWVCTPVILLTSNLVAVWQMIPSLKLGLQLLLAVFATLLVLPFLVVGELIRKSRQAR